MTKQPIIIQVFWVALKIMIKLLRVLLEILPDEPPKPRYSAMYAHFLYKEKAISGLEYAEAVLGNKSEEN